MNAFALVFTMNDLEKPRIFDVVIPGKINNFFNRLRWGNPDTS
jgi:hypothetical protein